MRGRRRSSKRRRSTEASVRAPLPLSLHSRHGLGCALCVFRTVTTEDFQASVEKQMLPGMDADANGRMNWFFRQYVYGTSLPSCKFEQSVDPARPAPVKRTLPNSDYDVVGLEER